MTIGRPAYGTGADALRDAAVETAKEFGIGGLSLRRVAERGGVTHGLVRHHFGSRRSLVEAALEHASKRTHFLSVDEDRPLSERIEETRGELRLQYEAALSGEYADVVDAIYADYHEEAAQWARDRGVVADPTTIALIGAVIDGLSIGRLAETGSNMPDAVVARLLDLLRADRD